MMRLALVLCLVPAAALTVSSQERAGAPPVAGRPSAAVPLPAVSGEITGPGPMFESLMTLAPGDDMARFEYQAREYLVPDHTGWESLSHDARYVHRVVGLASLWGRTVECVQGYRASYAYPAQLWIPTQRPDGRPVDVEGLALDLVDYGVPIELVDAGSRDAIVDALRERAAQP